MSERVSEQRSEPADQAPSEPGDAQARSAGAPGEQLEALQREVEENWSRYLRTAAELENLRKRSVRDVENARKYGLERLAQALLPVRDSLEAGIDVGENADAAALLEGKRATLRLLDQALQEVGISEVDPHGEPFDPRKHEALSVRIAPDVEPNTVVEVVQKGYQIHERLLRPARVIVARAPDEE